MQQQDRLWRIKDFVPGILPISKSKFWAGVAAGIYPQPVKTLGPRTTCWRASEIMQLVNKGAAGHE
jgi:prophage regulatory protein